MADPVTSGTANVGQNIEQTIDKLGEAAHGAAKDLGAAAGRAADSAMQQLGPVTNAVQDTARDLGAAANTMVLGCQDGFGAAWYALWDGNFGLATQHFGAATAACTDSISASLMGLFPGWWS